MEKLLKRTSREEVRNTERGRKKAIPGAGTCSFLHFPYADVDLDAVGRRAMKSCG